MLYFDLYGNKISTPIIKPFDTKSYDIKQSHYESVCKIPIRTILLSPSGGGKTVLLQNLILNVYKGCFAAIYIWSPSITVDDSWLPVKKYIDEHINLIKEKHILITTWRKSWSTL